MAHKQRRTVHAVLKMRGSTKTNLGTSRIVVVVMLHSCRTSENLKPGRDGLSDAHPAPLLAFYDPTARG